MAELVDARDLKSLGAKRCASSILAPGTNKINHLQLFAVSGFLFLGKE
jgi:hypothetical protein